jgi:hypothetical protein
MLLAAHVRVLLIFPHIFILNVFVQQYNMSVFTNTQSVANYFGEIANANVYYIVSIYWLDSVGM